MRIVAAILIGAMTLVASVEAQGAGAAGSGASANSNVLSQFATDIRLKIEKEWRETLARRPDPEGDGRGWRWRVAVFPPRFDHEHFGRAGNYKLAYPKGSGVVAERLKDALLADSYGLDAFDVYAGTELDRQLNEGNRDASMYDARDPQGVVKLAKMAGMDFAIFGKLRVEDFKHSKGMTLDDKLIRLEIVVFNIDQLSRMDPSQTSQKARRERDRQAFSMPIDMSYRDWEKSTGERPLSGKAKFFNSETTDQLSWGSGSGFTPDPRKEVRAALYSVARRIARDLGTGTGRESTFVLATATDDDGGTIKNSLTDTLESCLGGVLRQDLDLNAASEMASFSSKFFSQFHRDLQDLELVAKSKETVQALDKILDDEKALGLVWVKLNRLTKDFYSVNAVTYRRGRDTDPGSFTPGAYGFLEPNEYNKGIVAELDKTKVRKLDKRELSGEEEIVQILIRLSRQIVVDKSVITQFLLKRQMSFGQIKTPGNHESQFRRDRLQLAIAKRHGQLEKKLSSDHSGIALQEKILAYPQKLRVNGEDYQDLQAASDALDDFEEASPGLERVICTSVKSAMIAEFRSHLESVADAKRKARLEEFHDIGLFGATAAEFRGNLQKLQDLESLVEEGFLSREDFLEQAKDFSVKPPRLKLDIELTEIGVPRLFVRITDMRSSTLIRELSDKVSPELAKKVKSVLNEEGD